MTGADLLIRGQHKRKMPVLARLGDGSWLTRIGATAVRIIDADIVVTATRGSRTVQRVERDRLITTLADDKRYPAMDLVELYHQRWEIETSYFELKSSILRRPCPACPPARTGHPGDLCTAGRLSSPAHRHR
ncbi:transposase [Nocardia pseudovaccinii]|uniref:transposase n=1 Tax=Nocardia pseudovaccinii TaxID=189540 RepID=UPI003D8E2C2B